MCAVLVCAQKGASALNSFGYPGFRRIEARAFRAHSELSSKSRIVIRSITSSFSMRPILRALHETMSANYHADRTRDGLGKDTPQRGPLSTRNPGGATGVTTSFGRAPRSLFLGKGSLSDANGFLATYSPARNEVFASASKYSCHFSFG
jgi:hypothetical protein